MVKRDYSARRGRLALFVGGDRTIGAGPNYKECILHFWREYGRIKEKTVLRRRQTNDDAKRRDEGTGIATPFIP